MKCPSLFRDLLWEEFVSKFTSSQFLKKSKYLRENVFGEAKSTKKLNTIQEIFMHTVHEKVLKWAGSSFTENKVEMITRMKSGDENVYELQDANRFIAMIDSLKADLVDEIAKLHIRVFRVDQIATKNYFVKNFSYKTDWYNLDGSRKYDDLPLREKIEFKYVKKYDMPQVIRWYKNEMPIQKEDLVIVFEGAISDRRYTIFE